MIPVSLKALISPTMQDYCVYMHVYVSVYTPNEPIFNHQGKVMCVFFMFGVAISTFNLKSMMFCVQSEIRWERAAPFSHMAPLNGWVKRCTRQEATVREQQINPLSYLCVLQPHWTSLPNASVSACPDCFHLTTASPGWCLKSLNTRQTGMIKRLSSGFYKNIKQKHVFIEVLVFECVLG